MFSLLFSLFSLSLLSANAYFYTHAPLQSTMVVVSQYPSFETWSYRYNRVYLSATERDYRETVYNRNVARIARHNSHGHTWSLAVNKFADLTRKEFASRYLGGYNNSTRMRVRNVNWSLENRTKFSLPASVDWATKGAVTPVKNQGQCGSCWAFSTTGAVESAWFLKNGTLVSLSEQQLVDCSTSEGNQGCNGGLMDYGFQYVVQNGLTSEAMYPYTATGPNTCKAKGLPVFANLSGFKDVPTNSETALMTAIVGQPVSVAVEADQDAFQFYSSGVLTKACGSNLDHGVLAVGYGTQTGLDYYKVKNSWGADWGMNGYILLGRGASYGANGQCGIQMDASYPTV